MVDTRIDVIGWRCRIESRLLEVEKLMRFRSSWLHVLAAACSGLLVGASFAPLDLGPLILVALVPLLWAWREGGPLRCALIGFVAGLTWFGSTVSWSWYFGAIAFVPLIVALTTYLAAAGAVVGYLGRRGVRGVWVAAAAITLSEALRGRFPFGGLPWGDAGVALHNLAAARDLASWGGVPLLTFLVVAINGLLVDAFFAVRVRRQRNLVRMAIAFLTLAVASTAMVIWRVEPKVTGQLKFALVQGNDRNRRLTSSEIREHFLTQRHLELAENELDGVYDLIIFPESALDQDPEVALPLRQRIISLAEQHDAAILVNALTRNDGDVYNTNLLYEPDGTLQAKYSKQHLVPFGEYVPGRNLLGFIKGIEQVPIDYTPGTTRTIFDVKGSRVASVICFESAFAPLVRDFVRDGAELIVVTTNNRSYRRSANSAQHVALSQMRAAETARPVLHASISGITAVIDARGEIQSTTELFQNDVVTGFADTTTNQTPYVRFGSWPVWTATIGVLLAAGCAAVRPPPRQAVDRGASTPVRAPERDDVLTVR